MPLQFVLGKQDSIVSQFLLELRDKAIQKDPARFRLNLQRVGQVLAYEISKQLKFDNVEVETSLGKASGARIKEHPVLLTILRAGIPFFNGFTDYFDQSSCGFIGAYRKEGEKELTIKLDYVATPDLKGRDVILIDPMLATGKSLVNALEALANRGKPRHLFIACLVASPEGLKYLEENVKLPHSVWCAAVDQKLNEQFYIVPGLGDAGDLSYGEKI